jgi:hypothetical protein
MDPNTALRKARDAAKTLTDLEDKVSEQGATLKDMSPEQRDQFFAAAGDLRDSFNELDGFLPQDWQR